MKNLLEAQHLVKHYGDRVVVKDIDLIVAPGEVVGLIGPNGAGKWGLPMVGTESRNRDVAQRG